MRHRPRSATLLLAALMPLSMLAAGLQPTDPGLVFRWSPADAKITGTTGADATGKVTVKVVGRPGRSTIGPGEGTTFDGACLLLSEDIATDRTALPTREFTVSAWVNLAETLEYGGIIGAVQDNGPAEKGWLLGREGLVDGSDTALGHYTHEKSPVGAAAALATLDVIRDERLVDRSASLGEWFRGRLDALRARHPAITDVRVLGLLMGVELYARTDARGTDAAERVMYACLSRGLSFKVSGGNVLTLTPPLTLTDSEAEIAIGALTGALAEVLG